MFHEVAGGNLQIVRQFGKSNADTLFKGTYKGMMESAVSSGGAVKFIERYSALSRSLFNFVKTSLDKISENHIVFRVEFIMKPKEMLAEPYFTQLVGTLERVVELSGGKNPKIKITAKLWEGSPYTEYDVVWE